jgi:hypothetical protein
MGPSLVADQSVDRISVAISPLPANSAAAGAGAVLARRRAPGFRGPVVLSATLDLHLMPLPGAAFACSVA